MSEKKTEPASTPGKSVKSLDAVLSDHVSRFEAARTLRAGSILLRLIGEGGGDYFVHSTSTGCHASREPGAGPPHFEVTGDARRVRSILDGSREGRLQFFAGGIRVRGDLHYLSELAYEMGFIKEPF